MNPLEEYKKKRRFTATSEPKAKAPIRRPQAHGLRFVVHKHLATSDHYDLRLEIDGVLKSWAIPKGPSQDPTMKHLAVRVEDHPFEYKDFEGVIPKGNYGAGPVMIWDEGFYRPIGALASKNLSEAFADGLEKGHLVFALAGKKLNGEFALIKLKRASKNDWLLIKARDWYASTDDILAEDRSARSGRTMEEIKKAARKLPTLDLKMPKTEMPQEVHPMLATLVDKPFDNDDWIFEIKWDGYRTIAEVSGGKARIYSRNNLDFGQKFPGIVSSLTGFAKDAIFDGEIVVVDREGRSDFQLLQDYQLTGDGNLIYYIFDLLYYDGYDLTSVSLEKRREILKKIIPQSDNIQLSEDISGKGVAFYNLASKRGLEGIIAKANKSIYQTGRRSKDWLKIKNTMQQEAIICGYTKPRGARTGFGALILGVYEADWLVPIGNVGTGFNETNISQLLKKMKPLVIADSPFFTKIANDEATWVKPVLVCEVRFQEWTRDGSIRHPVYLGLREDKKPSEVTREITHG